MFRFFHISLFILFLWAASTSFAAEFVETTASDSAADRPVDKNEKAEETAPETEQRETALPLVEEEQIVAESLRDITRRVHLTYARTELEGIRERIEAHRLEPKIRILADFDRKYYEQKDVPAEFKEVVTVTRWKEFTAETALIVWLRNDYLGNADPVSGFLYVDHLGAYPIENASVTWKAVDTGTGRVVHTETVGDLYFRAKALSRACEIDFDLSKAGPIGVPTQIEIQAVLEFQGEKKNPDCPFSTHYAVKVEREGASPTKLNGGVFSSAKKSEDEMPRRRGGIFGFGLLE